MTLLSLVLILPNHTRAVDFNSRCNAAGVVICSGFDSDNEINSFVYGDERGNIRGVLDTGTKASGAGALRFTIPSLSSANSSGGYQRVINEFGSGFGQGSTFYIQFRQLFSPEMMNSAMGGSGWKQIALSSMFGSFGEPMEVGLFNRNLSGFPVLYRTDQSSVFTQNSIQYQTNQWMTFYLRLNIGTWGSPNSTITGWIGRGNTPMQQVFSATNIVLNNNPGDPSSGYNRIELSPHNSSKPANINHSIAYTWYDELIVSSQPIADPIDATPTPTPTPTPIATPTPTPTPVSTPTPTPTPTITPIYTPTPTPISTSTPTPIPSALPVNPPPANSPTPTPISGTRFADPVNLTRYSLKEGDLLSAVGSSDPDIYIVNVYGYKRLFLNPVIFNFYGHLGGWAGVKNIVSAGRDVFPTSGLFRNCETNDAKVYAVQVTGEDTGIFHWVNISGAQAVAEDPEFFKKVFCINTNEFNWYPKSAINYTSLSQVPVYSRN